MTKNKTQNRLYVSPREFSEITGIPLSKVRENIHKGLYPFYLPIGTHRWRMHVSHISSIMSGEGDPGDAREQKNKASGYR